MKSYKEWEGLVPEEIRDDSLWRLDAYRFGLFVAELGWHDAAKLMKDRRTVGLADQLYRSVGSISANIAT